MNDQTPQDAAPQFVAPSNIYSEFLKAVEKNGAYAQIFVDGKMQYWNVKKGATDHTVTDDNLVDFRPLSRKEQRKIFHTPYKYGRRIKA